MKLVPKRSKKSGLPPGTLIHIGEKKTDAVRLKAFDYDEAQCREHDLPSPDGLTLPPPPRKAWIDAGGIHRLDMVEALGRQLALHPLLLEDVVNTDQRPKLDDYGSYGYVVLKMLYAGERRDEIQVEQVSLVFGEHFLLSFQENGSDVFEPIRERLRTGKGRLRQLGVDYLLYSLIDAVVDRYFVLLETLGERVETLHDALLAEAKPELIKEIHAVKRELLFLRRVVWPLREVISGLQRMDAPLVSDATKPFLRDVYDHVIQIMDTIETLREMASGMLDIYLSSVSYRLNAVMKVLTVITTIFMPLTFIVGIYGMNFEHMPELSWAWGYPLVLLVMGAIAGGMLIAFKKKGWL